MTKHDRRSIAINAAIYDRLKAEADARFLSVARLAEALLEVGLDRLPPIPDSPA
jgi:hypothetical protein